MRLMRREKWMLAGLAIFFLVMGLVVFVIAPAGKRLDRLDGQIVQKKESLDHLLALQKEWTRVSGARDEVLSKIKARGKDFAIFSYLENLADEAGLKSQIQYMRPLPPVQDDDREGFIKRGLEVRLKGVGLKELITYLYNIEYSDKMLKVESIHLKPLYTDPEFINATLRVYTYDLT